MRTLAFVLLMCSGLPAQNPRAEEFFPMAVWYSGGKARAPMLERNDDSARIVARLLPRPPGAGHKRRVLDALR
jgi:hypothetical protein